MELYIKCIKFSGVFYICIKCKFNILMCLYMQCNLFFILNRLLFFGVSYFVLCNIIYFFIDSIFFII